MFIVTGLRFVPAPLGAKPCLNKPLLKELVKFEMPWSYKHSTPTGPKACRTHKAPSTWRSTRLGMLFKIY